MVLKKAQYKNLRNTQKELIYLIHTDNNYTLYRLFTQILIEVNLFKYTRTTTILFYIDCRLHKHWGRKQ